MPIMSTTINPSYIEQILAWIRARIISLYNISGRTLLISSVVVGAAFVLVRYFYHRYLHKYGGVDFSRTKIDREYDYIIVGSGSSGSVLANRLSADPSVSVLLVEAGGSDDCLDARVPAAAVKLQLTPRDWQYKTVPQRNSMQGMTNQISHWPRGRCLGGSSTLNYMLWVKPHPKEFDRWESQYGCRGWSYADVEPFFKKCESIDPNHFSHADHPHRGHDGPVTISKLHADDVNATSQAFIDGAKAIGLPYNPDYNGHTMNGVSLSQYTTRNGQRCNTATAYLCPILHRKNLHIATYAYTTRILFNDKKDAIGIVLRRGSTNALCRLAPDTVVYARREVIISAGAVASPQLLMLSGIGDRDELNKHNIPCVHHSPAVGANLQDHLFVPLPFESRLSTLSSADENIRSIANFFLHGRGALTSSMVEAFIFTSTGTRPDLTSQTSFTTTTNNNNNNNDTIPDSQVHFVNGTFDRSNMFAFNFTQQITELYINTIKKNFLFVILPTLIKPFSRGFIKLLNNDPFEKPLIDPNYLNDNRDLKNLILQCLLIEKLIKTKNMLNIIKKDLFDVFAPHCPYNRLTQPELFYTFLIKNVAVTVYHPTSTVRIGADDDDTSPLRTDLTVKGVQRLRVIDTSICPEIVNANTNWTAIMIGEKGADMIINKYKNK